METITLSESLNRLSEKYKDNQELSAAIEQKKAAIKIDQEPVKK